MSGGVRAEDFGAFAAGVVIEAFGHGENFHDGEIWFFGEDIAAGFFDRAEDVDHFGFGDADDVVGLDGDVVLGAVGVHDGVDIDLCGVEAAGGVEGAAFEREGAIFDAAGDDDIAAGVGAEASGFGDEFEEGAAAANLVNAWVGDGAEDGDGLAVEFEQRYGDDGSLEVVAIAVGDGGFEFFEGESGGVDATDAREDEIATEIDGEGSAADLFHILDADGEDVFGTELVGLGCGFGIEMGLFCFEMTRFDFEMDWFRFEVAREIGRSGGGRWSLSSVSPRRMERCEKKYGSEQGTQHKGNLSFIH